jgi:hypothetical protein
MYIAKADAEESIKDLEKVDKQIAELEARLKKP